MAGSLGLGRRRAAHEMHGLLGAGARLALAAAAVEGGGFGPGLVHGGLGADFHAFGPVAGDLQHGRDHAGVGAVAPRQRREQGVEDVGHLAQEFTGDGRRLGGGELQHHGQVVGQ